jgi:hypothetical protein
MRRGRALGPPWLRCYKCLQGAQKRTSWRAFVSRRAFHRPAGSEHWNDAIERSELGTSQMTRGKGRRRVANICRLAPAVVACMFALVGCATDSLFGSKPSSAQTSGSFGDQVGDFFRGQPAKTAADTPADIDCPPVQVREGAGTYSQNASSDADPSALSVRAQATFGQNARECHVNSGILTIKVGVQGRVILGPAGAPGDFVVPLRYALVQEGIQPKTIWTKFYAVPTSLPPGSTNVQFTHVMEDIAVPLPKSSELDAYVIYIGFDPNGLETPKAKPKPKPKARTSSATNGQPSAR